LLQEFKVLHHLLELFFGGGRVAPATALNHARVNERGQAHHQPTDQEKEKIFHS